MADDVTDPDATTGDGVDDEPTTAADPDATPAADEAPGEADDDGAAGDEAAAGATKPSGKATKATKVSKVTKASKTDKADKAGKDEAGASGSQPAKPEVRKKVVSKRVTPKGAEQGAKASTAPRSKSGAPEGGYSARYTPPAATYAKGPSPWWVPAIMFGLLIVGALVIMLNYMGVFGEAANLRLVIGLALILGGIITATQYR
jgi:hypothetical protein